MDKNEFSQKLKEVMDTTGYSMKDLAQKCGVPYSTIRGYLVGESLPAGIEQIQKISKATGVSISWLVGENTENCNPADYSKRQLELLLSLAGHLSDMQRSVILKQMLILLIKHTDDFEKNNLSDKEKLTPETINMALEFQTLSEEKRQAICKEYGLNGRC
ncbi:hypothetical protein A8A01_00190 [Ewingella americana]|nr:hypothetical protein A8A01_00190 [Ewingella americana]